VALLCAPLAGACASRGPKTVAVPQPFPVPRGDAPARAEPTADAPAVAAVPVPDREEDADSSLAVAAQLVSTALQFRGTPYKNGGTTPSGFDCSGFTQFVFGQYGLKLPREVRDQYGVGDRIEPNAIQPGDLLFFSTTSPGPSHVAIAIGEGRFVHAPSSRGVVRVEGLSTDYWARRFVGVRRLSLR
jgi:cell wall-associated NlpC family hydrolase